MLDSLTVDDDDVIGRILNISGGGPAFEYIRLWDQEKNLNSDLSSSINILASGCRALAEAPCRVAYCQALTRNNAFLTSIPTFQCGVAFSDLTSEHVRQLDMILESCGGNCHIFGDCAENRMEVGMVSSSDYFNI